MILRPPEHGDERRRDRQSAGDLAKVERHRRADQVRPVRRRQAILEDGHPGALRHPPERPLCEHVVRVRREATTTETAVDVSGEALEVRVDGAVGIDIRVRERVLLIGGECELATRSASERKPCPRHRRGTVRLDRQVDQPRGERLELQREHATDVTWRELGAVQCEEEARELGCRGDELVLVGRAQDAVAERERAVRLADHQVGGRQHPERPAHGVRHHDVIDLGSQHVDHRLDREVGRDHADGRDCDMPDSRHPATRRRRRPAPAASRR